MPWSSDLQFQHIRSTVAVRDGKQSCCLRHVEGRSEHDVPLDCLRGRLHLLHQVRVAHDPGSAAELPARLVHPHDRPHYGALCNIGEQADVSKGGALVRKEGNQNKETRGEIRASRENSGKEK